MAIFTILLANRIYYFISLIHFKTLKYHLNLIQIKSYILITAGSIVMFVMGLLDDISGLSSYFRFLVQVIIAFTLTYIGDLGDNFYGVLGLYEIPYYFSIIFSVSVMIFIINSFNLTDGLDGLAASLGLFILLCFAVIFYTNGKYFDCVLACAESLRCLHFGYIIVLLQEFLWEMVEV